jgi:crotonobetainyl-CoA:carnitine CoA-transferase CaiB-like acyl-CoA transferase
MLEGIRVIELGVWVAGPSAGGLLADWGADVIKVEAPAGDPMRQMLQVIIGHGEPQSPPFDLDNRGKRSVVLDLRTDEGLAAMYALVDSADVFVTNLRPEAVEELGLGPDALLARNERLVYASVTGYGRTGPEAGRAGYDVGAFWARSGIAHATAPDGEPPPALRGGLGDHVTGLTITAGILGALLERERSGRGQLVETSLLRTGIYCLGWDLGLQLRFDRAAPTQPRTENINPMVNCYRASDGRWFWLLGVESQRHFPILCRAVGREEWIDDGRFATARDRRHHAAELIAALDELFATQSRDDWVAAFDAHDVWWAPVNTLGDVVTDPQVLAAGGIVDVPAGAGAPAHRAVATPVSFRRTPV